MSGTIVRSAVATVMILTVGALAAEPPVRLPPSSRPVTARPAPATKPAAASKPAAATRPAATRSSRTADPVRDAVAMLFREATDAARAGKPFAHPEGDALAGRRDLPEPRAIEALAAQQSPDPRVDAYVKLNLLSAFDRFDPANANAAVRAYALGSPPLAIYPSADAHERQDWERKIGQVMSAEAVAKVNADYEAAIAKVAERNDLMLRYRDALRAKLAATDDPTWARIYAAQLEDLAQRSAIGIDTDKLLTPLVKQIEQWSAKAGRPAVRQMIASVNEYLSRKEPPIVFTKMTWNEKTRKARWGDREATLDQAKLKKLLETLKVREKDAK